MYRWYSYLAYIVSWRVVPVTCFQSSFQWEYFFFFALQQIHLCVMLLRLEKIGWGEK